MNRKWVYVALGAALMVMAACTQSTEPAREDTSCRSGYNVSSGRKC